MVAVPETTPITLITGAAGGIGRATAALFAARGHHLVVSDRDAKTTQAAADDLAAPAGVTAIAADVADADAVARLFQQIGDRLGRLDCAFNNAGVTGGGKPLLDSDPAVWDQCVAVNLSGTYHCMRGELSLMLPAGGGAIVNASSILGLNGGTSPGYTATKHGIAGLTKSVALTYADQGIRCNAVCPGLIDAGLSAQVLREGGPKAEAFIGLHPMGRAGTADEVAEAVWWLCSSGARFTTGQMLTVDGGYSAR